VNKLDTAQVLYLHGLMCSATGGASGVRDIAALESAIYHAFASFEGRDFYQTIEEKAARQAFGMIRNHPFVDGNKRIGLFVMLVFLELNHIKLSFPQNELVKLGTGVADGSVGPAQITEWIKRYKKKNSRK
jgi:death on curing protein